MDRAEAKGFGIALAGHAALLAALALGLATVSQPPILNQPMEVSFVEDVGMVNAVPEPTVEPPAQSVAPELGLPEEAVPTPSERIAPPEPVIVRPVPAPPQPKPVPRQSIRPAPAKPVPDKQKAKPAPSSGSGKVGRRRGLTLGDLGLSGIGSEATPSKSQKPTGAVMSAQALAGINSVIARQIQPCADRQVNPGPGANRITTTLNLRLNRDGSLASRPTVVRQAGVDDENQRYSERVADLAIAAVTGCSPLRDLPDELYRTANGGWSNINFRYRLP